MTNNNNEQQEVVNVSRTYSFLEIDQFRAEALGDYHSRNSNRHAFSKNTRGWRLAARERVMPKVLSFKEAKTVTFSTGDGSFRFITPTGWRVCPKTFSMMKG